MQIILSPHTHLGLTLVHSFISETEEQDILAGIAQTANVNRKTGSKVYRNSIQRFGDTSIFGDNAVSAELPGYFEPVIARLLAETFIADRPDAITVNEYVTGQTIHPHIDAPKAGPVITVLSLLSPAVMVFTRDQERFEVALPPRSLVQMRGVIRNDWHHEILPVAQLRYSIVFRGKNC